MPVPVSGGLVVHLETDSGVVESGGVVTSWQDASGLGNDLTASGDPTLGTITTPSGAAAIELDGTDDKFERLLDLAGLPDGSDDRTIFFVVKYDTPPSRTAGVLYGDGRKNEAFGLATDSDDNLLVQGYGGVGQNDFETTAEASALGWVVQSVVLEADVLRQYVNGTLIDISTHAFETDIVKLLVGADIRQGKVADLNVGAVLIYDRALDAQEVAQVEDYLQQKYLVDGTGNVNPVAIGDIDGTQPGGTTVIDVLSNDADDDLLIGSSVTIVTGPAFGTIDNINPTTGEITYTHDGGASAADSFTYTVTDADGVVSNEATVNLGIGVGQPLDLDGFTDELVLTRGDLQGGSPFFLPISMAFLPDNRMLLLSKDGEIRIVDPETGTNSIYMTLGNIDAGQERGLLDITLDPDFANNGYFYLYYTPNDPENAQIARFQHQENSGGLTSSGDLASEFTVWQDTDGYLACCHYGGGLDFGPDGKIWLTTSDKFQATTPGEGSSGGTDLPLDLASSSGKIIRVNSDGTVPDGGDGQPANPWADPNDGIDDYIWSYGLRNPFRARWDEEYGYMYIGEVGGNQQLIAHEDIHLASLDQPGAFYGWPFYEGTPSTYVNNGQSNYDLNNFPLPDSDLADPANGDYYSAPIFSIDHAGVSTSLTGGEVYRGDMFPNEWDGVYFYGDYTNDFIRYLLLDETGTQVLGDFAFKPSTELPGSTNEIVSLSVGNDGALYYLMIASGDVRRVTYDGNQAPDIVFAGLTPLSGPLPLSVTFNATVTDAEGDPLTYVLNFGDGTIETGTITGGQVSIGHLYQTDGRFDVSFSVSDPTHTVLSQALEVEAGDVNFAPEISDAASDVALAETGVTEVQFSAIATDPDNDTLSYTWHFGDGTSASGTVDVSGNVIASHIYATEGSFEAFLEVSDGPETVFSPNLSIQVGDATEVPVTAGLVLLLESDIKIGLGAGSTVIAWLDGSGRGNNLFAAGDPQLVENQTPTGQPAIVFDGTEDLLERVTATDTIFDLSTGNADRTIFFVVDYVDPEGVSGGVAYGDASSNETFGLVAAKDGDLNLQGYGRVNDFDSDVDAVTPGWLVQSVVLNNDAYNHYQNGILIDSGIHTFATDLQRLVIGAEIGDKGESQLSVGAVLFFDRALSEVERGQVEDFLQMKYITGNSNNTAPVAADDTLSFNEDTVLNGNVLADNGNGIDDDPDGDTLTVSLLADVANGSLVLNTDGSFTFAPASDYDGLDSFTYLLSDGNGGTDQATVSLTGIPADDPAVAADDNYTVATDTALVVTAPSGLLANDSDAEGDPFDVTGFDAVSVSGGAVSVNADGSFTYTPFAGFEGTDSFTYQITGGDSATASVFVGTSQGMPVTLGLVAAYQSGENVSLGAGNTVTGWLDGSGRGNDLLATGDPTLVSNATPTGQSAIAFDGVGDLLERVNATDTLNGLSAGSTDRTMFFVVDYLDPEGSYSGLAYGDDVRNETFGLIASSGGDLTVQGYGRKNDFISDVDGVTPGWLVQSVVLDDDAFTHYLNGIEIESGIHTFDTDLERLIVAAEINHRGESQMNVGAVMIYDRALSEAERIDVEEYLQQLYIDDTFMLA